MGWFKTFSRVAKNVALVPVAVAQDTATLGGMLSGRWEEAEPWSDPTYTGERLRKLVRNEK